MHKLTIMADKVNFPATAVPQDLDSPCLTLGIFDKNFIKNHIYLHFSKQ